MNCDISSILLPDSLDNELFKGNLQVLHIQVTLTHSVLIVRIRTYLYVRTLSNWCFICRSRVTSCSCRLFSVQSSVLFDFRWYASPKI